MSGRVAGPTPPPNTTEGQHLHHMYNEWVTYKYNHQSSMIYQVGYKQSSPTQRRRSSSKSLPHFYLFLTCTPAIKRETNMASRLCMRIMIWSMVARLESHCQKYNTACKADNTCLGIMPYVIMYGWLYIPYWLFGFGNWVKYVFRVQVKGKGVYHTIYDCGKM